MANRRSDTTALVSIAAALSDEGRVRALLLLRGGELCLCQVIEVLGLAPSTVSKHMSILYAAGLVVRRKEGKWHYYRLAGRGADPAVRGALRWVLASADGGDEVDGSAGCCAPSEREEAAAACYRS